MSGSGYDPDSYQGYDRDPPEKSDPLGGLYEPEPVKAPEPKLSPRLSKLFRLFDAMDKADEESSVADKQLAESHNYQVQGPTTDAVDMSSIETGLTTSTKAPSKSKLLSDAAAVGEEKLNDMRTKIQTAEDLDKYYAEASKLADTKAALYNSIHKQATDDYKAGRIDAKTFTQRNEMLIGENGKGGMRAGIEQMRRNIAEGKAVAANEQKFGAAGDTLAAKPGTPAFLQKTPGGELAWEAAQSSPVQNVISKLAAPMEMAGAMGSLASDALGGKMGTDLSAMEYLNDSLGTGAFDEDSKSRKRGREFWTQAGRNLAVYHDTNPVASALTNPADMLMTDIDLLTRAGMVDDENREEYNALAGELVVSTMADPLNVVGEVAKPLEGAAKLEQLLYKNRAFSAFAAKVPKIAYAPGKFVRYAVGKGREAQALGDPRLTRVMMAERTLAEEAGYEFLSLRYKALDDIARVTKPLGKVQRARLAEELPGLVERGKDARMALRESEDVYHKALVEAADLYDDAAAAAYLTEKKYGMKVTELVGPYEYFGRRFSDEFAHWLNTRPDAQRIMFDDAIKQGGLGGALESWEKARKMPSLNFYESEAVLRKKFARHGMPEDMPVWGRDAFGDLAKRASKSLDDVKARNFGLNFMQEFGSPTGVEAIDDLLRRWGELDRAKVPEGGVAGVEAGAANARAGEADAAKVAEQAQTQYAKQRRAATEANAAAETARSQWQEASGGYDDAVKARKQAKADYFKAQEGFLQGESGANESMQDATRRLLEAQDALRNAKKSGASPERIAGLERKTVDAQKASAAAEYGTSQAAERMKSAREAAAKAEAEARDWEQKATRARAEWDKQARAAQHGDPDSWSVHAKAKWARGQAPEMPPGINKPTNALDELMKMHAPLPDDMNELARLAHTWLSPEDAKVFAKYTGNFYWNRLPKTPNGVGQWWDDWKRIFQKATLASPASLMKDHIGTIGQMFLSGNFSEIPRALKDLGGTPWKWASGAVKPSPDVMFLRARGALNTTIAETFTKPSGKGWLRPTLQKYGVAGTMARPFGKRAAEGMSRATDVLLHQRQFIEEAGRLATYRKGLRDGLSKERALEEIWKYWGKFDELIKLERDVFNRIFFFWSWKARSIPITLTNFVEKPVKMRLLLMATAGDARGDKGDGMPEWLKRMGGWTLQQDENGNSQVASTGSSMYSSALIGFLQGDMVKAVQSGEWSSVPEKGMRELLQGSPPIAQSAIELATSHDYFTDQDWWKDRDPSKGSNMKAPSFMYWLTNKGKGEETTIQKMLDLKPEFDENNQLRRVTMSPRWAWILDALPGVSARAADISSFVDPRKETPGAQSPTGKSLLPGISRQLGVPIYHVKPPDNLERDIRELRKGLRKDVQNISGNSLFVDDFNRVRPNTKSMRGKRLQADMDEWKQQAKSQKLGPAQAKQYIDERVKRLYLDEWRIMELSDRLDRLHVIAKEGPRPVGDMELPLVTGKSPESRYTTQANRERKAADREFESMLKGVRSK